MIKWCAMEVRTTPDLDRTLNKLARQGWALHSVVRKKGDAYFDVLIVVAYKETP